MCFVRDVRPQVSKLDPKSLKCIFMGYSWVQKGYRCYCPTLRRYFVSTDVAFIETTTFSLSSTVTSQGGMMIYCSIRFPYQSLLQLLLLSSLL